MFTPENSNDMNENVNSATTIGAHKIAMEIFGRFMNLNHSDSAAQQSCLFVLLKKCGRFGAVFRVHTTCCFETINMLGF